VNSTTVQNNGVYCGDHVCTALFSYESLDDWNELYKHSFNNDDTGSMFIEKSNKAKEITQTIKLVFVPSSNGVIFNLVKLKTSK